MHTQLFLPIRAYFELTKPRITLLVVLTVLAGFYLASEGKTDIVLLLHTAFGTALIAGGTSAFNQLFEADIDARMRRTQSRPLPTGRLKPRQVFTFGAMISLAGIAYLFWLVNPLCALIAATTFATYVFIYTPLKQKTPLATIIGAVPGALPPVGGWAAARGELSIEAGILFAILFLWQIPHFLAIAWIYREDYARSGLKILSVVDRAGRSTSRHILTNTAALLVISLLPTLLGMSGKAYFYGAAVIGALFLLAAINVSLQRTTQNARRLLLASVLYLPVLLMLMSFDKM